MVVFPNCIFCMKGILKFKCCWDSSLYIYIYMLVKMSYNSVSLWLWCCSWLYAGPLRTVSRGAIFIVYGFNFFWLTKSHWPEFCTPGVKFLCVNNENTTKFWWTWLDLFMQNLVPQKGFLRSGMGHHHKSPFPVLPNIHFFLFYWNFHPQLCWSNHNFWMSNHSFCAHV